MYLLENFLFNTVFIKYLYQTKVWQLLWLSP